MRSYSVNFANYTIGEDAYERAAEVCGLYGSRILLIGGKLALEAAEDRLRKALEAAEERFGKALEGSRANPSSNPSDNLSNRDMEIVDSVLFGEDCSFRRMEELADYAQKCGADMIFGMGGGKALDTAKGAAEKAGLPIFTFPTIASTCAATTALSVVYREDGNFDSFYYYDKPARHCFIDTRVIAEAPQRYLRAGIGDTIGKFFECHFAARGDRLTHSSALGREFSNMCYAPFLEYGKAALEECSENRAGEALEQAVLANIVSTGLVSLLVLDEYNGALAHSVYYGLVLLPGFEEKYLHGDVVAYGVLVQLAVDKEWEKAAELKHFLESIGIRTTLAQMEIPVDVDYLKEVLREAAEGPDMEHIPYPITEEMIFDAMVRVEELD